jgi:hypothetical protein
VPAISPTTCSSWSTRLGRGRNLRVPDPGSVRPGCSSCPQDLSPDPSPDRQTSVRDHQTIVGLTQAVCRKPLRIGLSESLCFREVLRGARQQADLQALCVRAGDLEGGLQRCRGVPCAAYPDNRTIRFAAISLTLEPSDGLEPSTPSLPWSLGGKRSQPTATVFAYLSRFRPPPICQRLPPVATAGLHKGSILRCLLWLRRLRRLMTRGAVRDRVVKACARLV